MTQKTDLLLQTDPFDFTAENSQFFIDSFRENALFHYENHEFTKKLWDFFQFHPTSITTEEDLLNIPYTMIHLFKEHEFCSVPRDQVELTLTSSGTGGQKSVQFLSAKSLDNVKRLALSIHQSLGMVTDNTYNYLCFTYDPSVARDLGTAFTDELLTNFTKKNEVYYAIEWREDKNKFELNEEGVLAALKRFEESELPCRILGFPALLYNLILKYNIKVNLGSNSWLQTGGGWKNYEDKEISKTEFRQFIFDRLGIPESHQRDLFGMVEHGIPYVDCQMGNLHIPNYARVFIRDPKTLKILPEGEVGLAHFLCSYNFSYPAMSLLTTDYARLGSCTCSLGGKVLELKGRAGVSKHKGCAITALEAAKG